MSASPETAHAIIRRLHMDDVQRVHAVERAAYPFPWSEQIFVDCLRAGYACFGLQLGHELAGYAIFNWAAGEAHLLNLCVHPDRQHQGYGSMLLEFVIEHVARLETEALYLEVRTSNPLALQLYASRGFTRIGRRPAYYKAEGGREDAIVMRLELRGSAA